MESEIVRLTARVSHYKSQAIHDDFMDGTSNSFDLTVLTVVEPESLKGRELNVIHSTPPPDGSVWMNVGKEYIIELEQRLLKDPDMDLPPESIQMISEL